MLDLLAQHPSTALFMCRKLATLLVYDLLSDRMIADCASVFLATAEMENQIAQVVYFLLTSTEFNKPDTYRGKIVTPLELVVRTVRGLQAQSEGGDLPGELRRMSQPLFEYPVPTGFSEIGDDWINSNQLLERIRFVNRVARNTPGGNRSTIDPVPFFKVQGYETGEAIVSFLSQLMIGAQLSSLERDIALHVLTDQGAQSFDINAADADAKLRRLVGTMLSFPSYQYQ